jgi:hypothetical protein
MCGSFPCQSIDQQRGALDLHRHRVQLDILTASVIATSNAAEIFETGNEMSDL